MMEVPSVLEWVKSFLPYFLVRKEERSNSVVSFHQKVTIIQILFGLLVLSCSTDSKGYIQYEILWLLSCNSIEKFAPSKNPAHIRHNLIGIQYKIWQISL